MDRANPDQIFFLILCYWYPFVLPHMFTLSPLGKNFSRNILKYFSYFSQKTGFDIPKETICVKCLILFSGNNKKKIINLFSELAEKVVKVKWWTEVTNVCSSIVTERALFSSEKC